MIAWSKSGLSSLPTGEAKRLGLIGIFTVRPPHSEMQTVEGKYVAVECRWELKLQSVEFSFVWGFPSKTRCHEFAEALVVAWGLGSQVEGTPEPNPDDRHTAISQRDMRFAMGYRPNVRKEYVQ